MKQWKVGRITLGLFLIGMGILLALNTMTTIPIDKVLSLGWPILLIVLGIEVLVYQVFKKNENWSFDGFSIFLIFIAGFSILVVYTVQSVGVIPMIKNSLFSQAYSVEIEESLVMEQTSKEITIDIPNGDIQVIGTSGDRVRVSGIIRSDGSDAEDAEGMVRQAFSVNQIGDKVVIKLASPNNNFAWIPNQTATLAIEAPENMAIKVNVINGKVDVKGFQQNVEVDGRNLAVDIADIVGIINVKNTNGKVDIRNISGAIDAVLTNGNVNVIDLDVLGDVSLRTVNGNVSIELLEENHVEIIANTTNGRVEQNFINEKEKSFEHTLGNGAYKVELKTTNGNIIIEEPKM